MKIKRKEQNGGFLADKRRALVTNLSGLRAE
jgi:hypothetical protein